MSQHTNEYESVDKAALEDALLAMRVCPRCRQDLQPVALCDSVWGCRGKKYPTHTFETWFLPKGEMK